jgi:hypothetical protein
MSAKHAQNPRLRPVMSAEQRAKLSAAQKAYVANDPRWPAHRQKLANANVANRMTLFPIAAIVAMRKRGRTFSYIAEEIGIDRHVLQRELKPERGPWHHLSSPTVYKHTCVP